MVFLMVMMIVGGSMCLPIFIMSMLFTLLI